MTDLLSRPQWEPQFFAVCVLGKLAARDSPALDLLRQVPAGELHWQVNEGLAFAFDYYCAGYQEALPEIRRWLGSPHANQRRVELLAGLGADPSPYVQTSAGNALRYIWRAHPQLVVERVQSMVGPSPVGPSRLGIAKLALRAAVELDPGLARLFEKD